MKNRTIRFLILSILCIAALCVVVFSFMTSRMNKRGAEAIEELGSIYMTGMSEQIATHFGTTFELRLSQVGALVDSVSPEGHDSDSIRVALRYNAHARGFDYLALLSKDGRCEMLAGKQIDISNKEEFIASLSGGEGKMGVGYDADGEELVLMGIRAEYPMSDGTKSAAFLAALPISYISETLSSKESENSLIYYFIIDKEGDFIVCDDEVDDENYFQRVSDKYEEIKASGGDGYGTVGKEEYLARLQKAMDDGRNFRGEFSINGVRRFLFGNSLPSSEWYLLLFMPYGQIDNTVNALGREWRFAAVVSCLAILAALSFVTAYYLALTRRHVREVENSKRIAEHANRAKSEFLSNMSHDIRTPMNGIVGMAAIAKTNLNHPEQIENCLNKIELSSRHLLGLINDILDMSKIESGKLELHGEKISLQDSIQSVVNIVQPQANEKNQTFDVYVFEREQNLVLLDGVRFNQILINLLGNAVKFTPERGKIRLECAVEPSEKEGYCTAVLRVIDNGIGMSREFQAKIFDAFAREDNKRVQKTEGTGLGMAITKYIVDAMGGTIQVKSELGVGSEFEVRLELKKEPVEEEKRLPFSKALLLTKDALLQKSAEDIFSSLSCELTVKEEAKNLDSFDAVLIDGELKDASSIFEANRARPFVFLLKSVGWAEFESSSGVIIKPLLRPNLLNALSASEEPEKDTFDFTGKRVLLAEDNELNREIAEELLSEIGLKVEHAEDGKVCADLFASSEVGYYDCILMDIRMPVMSGYEATEAIRAMDRQDAKTIPIIAMSADAFSDDVEHCLACGMNAHTSKPIDMDIVAKLIAKFVGSNAHRKERR